ncbi:hypothetical protein DRP07_11700 [Archaeoglobales archaeon]|nr:MAG: hypothetical protein DRP07_11700 [Archaeoglobales archaeon]
MFYLSLLLMMPVHAQELQLSIPKHNYTANEVVNITVNLKDFPQKEYIVSLWIYGEDSQNFRYKYPPYVVKRVVTGKTVFSFPIHEEIPPGRYIVVARLYDNSTLVASATGEFNIYGTMKRFDFDIHLCKDRECTKRGTSFTLERGFM